MAKRDDQLKKLCENKDFAEKILKLTSTEETIKLFGDNGVKLEKNEAEAVVKMLKLEKEGKLSNKMKEDILQGEIPDELLEEVNGGFFGLICLIVGLVATAVTVGVTVKQTIDANKEKEKQQKAADQAAAQQHGSGFSTATGDTMGGGGSLEKLI